MEADSTTSMTASLASPGLTSSEDTSATSPSSIEGGPVVNTGKAFAPSSHISPEASKVVSDLSNYVALGCICYEDFCRENYHGSLGVWQDVLNSDPFVAVNSLAVDMGRLLREGWIFVQSSRSLLDVSWTILRVYVLPHDVARRHVDRRSKKLSGMLERIVHEVDMDPETWAGRFRPGQRTRFDASATKDEGSLFYMFNCIPSPHPSTDYFQNTYAREALEDLLDSTVAPVNGLRTNLYPYQRRSAGLMLERESVVRLEMDPRLETRPSPDGSEFFYTPWDMQFFRKKRVCELARGGILAETMGLGKTVICLALILATKDQLPEVPPVYVAPIRRERVGSLADMAVSAINMKSIPWKIEFERIRHASGAEMQTCTSRLEQTPPCYEIPLTPLRWNRTTRLPPAQRMTLAATTIIVVPGNLYKQWQVRSFRQLEIAKHVHQGALRVLYMDSSKVPLPASDELRSHDVILFSRSRFELEDKHGSDDHGRRMSYRACSCPYIGSTRTIACNCVTKDMLYESPLRSLHFKRLIIDEGHFFSNADTKAMGVINKLMTADHRWIVSGTPAKDLLGVEVEMSAAENLWQLETKHTRETLLEQRRDFSDDDRKGRAIDSLGSLLTNFLKMEPWATPDDDRSSGAAWKDYVFRHEDVRKRTFSGYSRCLRRTLESVVVKTQAEDVEKDIELPPLTHKIVHLEPSFYDKLTANLFTLVLTANAVTSERTDNDYLFHNHKDTRKFRYQLVANLRQSAFFWTGFSEDDVLASIKASTAYLNKEGTNCTQEDRELLWASIKAAETIVTSAGWKALSRSHELGVFLEGWPEDSMEHWAFNEESLKPLMTGVSQLLVAQKFVNDRLHLVDPGEGLCGAGIRALAPVRFHNTKVEEADPAEGGSPLYKKSGIPISSFSGEPRLLKRASTSKKSPSAFKVTKRRKTEGSDRHISATEPTAHSSNEEFSSYETHSNLPGEGNAGDETAKSLPPGSAYATCKIIGTTSAKLSYLISEISKHEADEKIIVFYSGDNIAYYIAQVLELLHIKHEIYAASLSAQLKSQYVVRFDQECDYRVLLMDVKQAAFGLNISSASRIYFVNPVCRPSVEAQAIKRAHRIGQTREVHVETLVLKDTIEEKMVERSRRMTSDEHRVANIEDDAGIRQIIEDARPSAYGQMAATGYGQLAALTNPQQLWGRPGRCEAASTSHENTLTTKKRSLADENDMMAGVEHHSSATTRCPTLFDGTDVNKDYASGDNHSEDNEPDGLRAWSRPALARAFAECAIRRRMVSGGPALPSMSLDAFSEFQSAGASNLALRDQAYGSAGPSSGLAP